MKKVKFISNLLITSLLCTTSYAGSYYLLYDPGCVERLEYAYAETRPGQEFVVYTVFLSETEKLQLEVGIESQAPILPSRPAAVIDCSTADRSVLSANLMETVNNKIHQLYVVVPVGNNQYRIVQVKQVNYYKNDGTEIAVNSAQYRFRFYRDGRSNAGDLSNNDSRGKVFFMEIAEYGACRNTYVFRQTYSTPGNFLDIYVVPEFGIAEERSGSVDTNFKLLRVNGSEAANYLRQVCELGTNRIMNRSTTASGTSQPESYEGLRARSGAGVAVAGPRQHTVEAGETQFSICRRYQIYLADFQKWNNLTAQSVIQTGSKVFIEPPVAQQATDLRSKSGMLPEWETISGVYTVQSGDNVATLARRFGYTEERFRYFNNLTPTAILRPGDQVKTTDCDQSASQGALDSYEAPQSPAIAPQTSQPKSSPYYQDPYAAEEAPAKAASGLTAKSAAVPAADAGKVYYGPVPGVYNYSQPLYEPIKGSRVMVYENTADIPAPYDVQSRSAVPAAATSAKGVPTSYDFQSRSPQPSATGNLTGVTPKGADTSFAPGATRRVHIVREGETVNSIARRYGMTEDQIRQLNNMDRGDTVLPLQRIYVN